ncbi:MAG: HEAT repeat domain-containing protein [Pseudomonadota bacterium]
MGLFDFLKGKDKGKGKSAVSWALQRKIKKALNKYVQAQERQGALSALVEDNSDEAIKALLRRLTFLVEPLTTDETEKEYVADSLIEKGPRIIPLLLESIKSSSSIMWQLNIYKELVSEEELLQSLLAIMDAFDTEYEKDPQRKIQIIETLGEWKSTRVAGALKRFLDDVDETVRYQTVTSLLLQEPEIARDWLLERALSDESNRIRDLVIDGFVEKEVPIKGFHARKQFEEMLPADLHVDGKGLIKKKGPRAR